MNVLEKSRLASPTNQFPALDSMTLDTEAADIESLRIRTELMLVLRRYIRQQQWSQEEAAHVFHQSCPRMQNLLNGEISRFSVEDLLYCLTKIGLTVKMSVQHTDPADSPLETATPAMC